MSSARPVAIVFRGKPLELSLDPAQTVGALKERLAVLTSLPPAHQKLFAKGRPLDDDAGLLGAFLPAAATAKPKWLLIGTTAKEVEELREAEETEKAEQLARRTRKTVSIKGRGKRPDQSPYRFQGIEALPGFPDKDKAHQLLTSLANDPGVQAVMDKHKWSVGVLKEMPPEGKVGNETAVQSWK